MDFNSIEEIKKAGFQGFKKISELLTNYSLIPDQKGVYFVLFIGNESPQFNTIGTGGNFKGKNPNVAIDELLSNWLEDAIVVYIGKAGGSDNKATLKSRLTQFLKFGQGNNIGHWGGRYIWQIKNSNELIICWKPIIGDEPRNIEKLLIQEFSIQNGTKPFANIFN